MSPWGGAPGALQPVALPVSWGLSFYLASNVRKSQYHTCVLISFLTLTFIVENELEVSYADNLWVRV